MVVNYPDPYKGQAIEQPDERPSGKYREDERGETEGHVVLCLDISQSMEGIKLMQAKEGALGWAQNAIEIGYNVGLVSFSSQARYACALSDDLSRYRKSVQTLEPIFETNMRAALDLAGRILRPLRGRKVICLVTDGMPWMQHIPTMPYITLVERNYRVKEGIEIICLGIEPADNQFLKDIETIQNLKRIVKETEVKDSMEDLAKLLPPIKKLKKT